MSELQIGTIISYTWLIGIAVYLIMDGHQKAVKASEDAIRAEYDKAGESREASRKLMREAGYNV